MKHGRNTSYRLRRSYNPLLKDTQSVTPPEEPEPESEPEDDQALDRQKVTYLNGEEERDSENVNIPGTGISHTESNPGEWIIVTDEIRSLLVSLVGDLQKSRMTYAKIGTLIGMSNGRFSELHQGKMKKILRAQYEGLMNIP